MSRPRSSTQISLPSIREMLPEHFTARSAVQRPDDPHQLRHAESGRSAAISPTITHRGQQYPHSPDGNVEDWRRPRSLSYSQYYHVPSITPITPPSSATPARRYPELQDLSALRHTQPYARSRRNNYDNEKRHVCQLCGKGFNRPSSLNTHMNSHTGAKPYQCPKCGQLFSVKSNMNRHYRTHSTESTSPLTLACWSTSSADRSPTYPLSSPSAYSSMHSPPYHISPVDYCSDSDSEDASDHSALHDGDSRHDFAIEEANLSFARVRLGSH